MSSSGVMLSLAVVPLFANTLEAQERLFPRSFSGRRASIWELRCVSTFDFGSFSPLPEAVIYVCRTCRCTP